LGDRYVVQAFEADDAYYTDTSIPLDDGLMKRMEGQLTLHLMPKPSLNQSSALFGNLSVDNAGIGSVGIAISVTMFIAAFPNQIGCSSKAIPIGNSLVPEMWNRSAHENSTTDDALYAISNYYSKDDPTCPAYPGCYKNPKIL
jgi:hypothetical protein